MPDIDVEYVRDLLSTLHLFLDNLLSEAPEGEIQRRLVVDMDEKTFLELARLKNRCLTVIRQLETRP